MSSGHDYRDKCCTNITCIIIIVIIYDNIVALCGHKASHMYMEPVIFFVVVSPVFPLEFFSGPVVPTEKNINRRDAWDGVLLNDIT